MLRAIETAIAHACVVITRCRLSNRSASTPATRPKSVNGRKRQKARMPTASGDRVWSATNQARAIICIHVPKTDTSCPLKKRR